VADDAEKVIVCAPLGWDHTPDSIQITADCGHEIWIAPAGQRVLADGGKARCVPCVIPLLKDNPDVVPEAAPGVLDDIERHKGGWERAKYEAFAKQIGLPTNG
jgi:hypothetical protein